MKKLAIITIAVITIVNTASAGTNIVPRLGGGFNYYGSDGFTGTFCPRSSGYKYYGSKRPNTWICPRFGGGSNYFNNTRSFDCLNHDYNKFSFFCKSPSYLNK